MHHRAQLRRATALTGLAMTALALCLIVRPSHSAENKSPTQQQAPLLQADALSYDENEGIVTAMGNVEVALNDKMLRADQVVYNKKTSVIRAQGHVALTESSGEILHAPVMELTSDVKQGFIERVGVLFPDNSRLAANDAQRYEGRYLIADKGVYSSCDLCKSDPSKPPLWQLKGKRITHDSQKKDVIYRDATLEFAGVPVFYTPYFAHPDPSVKRRQGLLTPTGGVKNTLGTMVRLPYYFDLADNSDLVVTPTLSTVDKLQLQTDWRHRFSTGDMKWTGSITKAEFTDETGDARGERVRGHLFGNAKFDLTNTWRAGTDVALTTDKSYLPRYDISSEDILVNRAFVENFKGRNYAVGNTYYFQDLRPGTQLAEPLVMPELRYSAFGEPGQALGGRWSFNSGMLTTTRTRDAAESQQGPNTRRLSVDAGWERQFISNTGFLTTISTLARADNYWADHVSREDSGLGTGFTNIERTRTFAQGDITVRYPFGRHGKGYQQILEPIAMLSAAPRVKREILPNEDSLDLEFDETNLFSVNRFSGIDRIEGGTRTAYGLRHAIIGNNGARIEMVGGQVFRLKKDPGFTEGSGLEKRVSDTVGRVDLEPAEWLQSNYGFRLDQNNLKFARQEFDISAGAPIFRPYLNYIYAKQIETTENVAETIEEGTLGFSTNFMKFWKVSAYHRQAFAPAPGPRNTNISLMYQDECFKTGVTAKQNYTSRLDVSSGKSIMFEFNLRNIGGFSTQ